MLFRSSESTLRSHAVNPRSSAKTPMSDYVSAHCQILLPLPHQKLTKPMELVRVHISTPEDRSWLISVSETSSLDIAPGERSRKSSTFSRRENSTDRNFGELQEGSTLHQVICHSNNALYQSKLGYFMSLV